MPPSRAREDAHKAGRRRITDANVLPRPARPFPVQFEIVPQ
jgi:hypothetical protein